MFSDGNQEVNNECKYSCTIIDSSKDTNTLIKDSYEAFCECMNADLQFMGQRILYKTEKDLHTMKELGFQHIISMKNNLGIRIYEPNRMIYVPLIKEILSDCSKKTCNHISIYRDNKDICIWCRKNKFLIVLTPRKDGYLLNTAYPVIYTNKINEIEKKANENGL